MEIGRVRYARNGGVRLAYRILGDGETTLDRVPGYVAERTDEFDGRDWVRQAIDEWLAKPRGLLHGH